MSAAPNSVPGINPAEAIARTASGAWLLDVRENDEWEAGHSAAAHFLPMSQLQERVDEVPSDVPVLVICRSGARSAAVTGALRQAGYDATNVTGGMQAWRAAGGDVLKSDGAAGQVI
ncbi:rhodanese-like domain-containing protein [Microbacteriaceae bacterium 4G12]